MKTIITRGTKTVRRTICACCGCEFEYEACDVQKELYLLPQPGLYDTGIGTRVYITCPQCCTKIYDLREWIGGEKC